MRIVWASLVAVLASSACYESSAAHCDNGASGCACDASHACAGGLRCQAERCVSTALAAGTAAAAHADQAAPPPADAGKSPRDAAPVTPVTPFSPVGDPIPGDAGKSTRDAAPADGGLSSPDPGVSSNTDVPCGATKALALDKLDLLFMVDNSNSMAQEQEALKAQFPKLINVLTSGQRFPGDPNPFPAASDLHVGVVSSDMGIPGVNFGANVGCLPDGGDDGRLQHAPHDPSCSANYPAFLSYNSGTDPTGFANDFQCIATLGTNGCGFEQQLEAPLKALWPSVFKDGNGNVVTPNPITFLATTSQGTLGRGDVPAAQGGNAGFLRNDPSSGLSLIAIVVVTDEEDCSSRTTEHLKPTAQEMGTPYFAQDLNLRCHYNPSLLFDVANRYLKGFRLLRQGNENLVVFAAITGVPERLVTRDVLAATDFSDSASRDKFYDNILNDPAMQETIDPTTNPGSGSGNLVPSCVRTDKAGNTATAYPPRRIVQLAKLFGENGIVQSICQDDFGPAMDAIINVMAKRFQNPSSCLQ